MKQRDMEWRTARLGDVTASRFHDVLTEPKAAGIYTVRGQRGAWRVMQGTEAVSNLFPRKVDADDEKWKLLRSWRQHHWSATAESYLCELLAELIHCQPLDVWRTEPTDWGMEQEPHAFELAVEAVKERYKQDLRLPIDEYAYIHHASEPHVGCSPDGIIGDDGLLELKAPYSPAKWIAAYRRGLKVPREYVPQIQGQLWVTGRKWCAFGYYDPRVVASGLDPLLMIRIERDDDYIDNTLAPRVLAFRDYRVSEYKSLVQDRGPF